MNLFQKLRSVLVILFLLTPALAPALLPPPAARAQSGPSTYDTNLVLNPRSNDTRVCFDSLNPTTLLVSEAFTGTSTLNWRTGARTALAKGHVAACGPNGTVYVGEPDAPGTRFNTLDGSAHPIARTPQYVAADGSRQVYATEVPTSYTQTLHLWASADAGDTWQERPLPPTGQLASLAVAETDARAIYVVMEDRLAPPPRPSWIYFSADAGATWTLRWTGGDPNGPLAGRLTAVPGAATPVERLYMASSNGLGGSGGRELDYISTDGARTFTLVDINPNTGFHSIEVVHSQEGIVRSRHGQNFGPQELTLTTDGGATWTPLHLPGLPPPTPAPGIPARPAEAVLSVARVAPANLFLSDLTQGLWHSPDNGHTWTQLLTSGARVVATSPYLPLAVLWTGADDRLHVTELPDAGRHQPAAVLPNHAGGSAYFPVPGVNHNVPEVFVRYWAAHGGLAQFGYPRTDAFPELNAADGHVYLAQYFERARFEYHPDYTGTESEILLGLLGVEQTAARRAAGEAPFLPVPPTGAPGVMEFQNGHTLRGKFLQYWEAHGALALYGYPISEEFQEVNPTDGHTYTVQYFERNRFELHPEYAGSPYEVLLGLLGNTLLEQKGWQ